jgi:translation initiation factor IF-3
MGKQYNVNSQIKAERINLILTNGEVKEDCSLSEALGIAQQAEMDLVEVSTKSNNGLIVCKILNYGKMLYKQSKQQKSHKVHVKEIRYSFNISEHDLKTKHRQIFKFLSKNYVVKYILELKGRESNLVESAVVKIDEHLEDFKTLATWEKPKVSRRNRGASVSTMLRAI